MDQKPNDTELITRCQKGDCEAFDILYERYRLPLFGYLNRLLTGYREQVDDIFQQVWIKACRNWQNYDDRQRFFAWLCRIGHNLVMDFYRRDARNSFTELTELLPGDRATPSQLITREELATALTQAVNELPEEQRVIVKMREDGLSFKDIAEKLHVGLNTALGRMHYAVLALRKKLHDYIE